MKQFTMTGTLLVCLLAAVLAPMGCQPPDPSMQLKPIVDKVADAWNTGHLEQLDAIIAPGYVRHANLAPDVKELDGLKKAISASRAMYPDQKVVIDEMSYSGTTASCRWTFTATNTGAGEMPPTGKSVKIWGVSIFHIANGKVTDEWVAFDTHATMTQLGYTTVPPPAAKM